LATTFKDHANVKPIPVQLNILVGSPHYMLFPDGNTFSVLIPIERQQFHLGGGNNTLLESGFGILDRADDPFPSTSQALTTTNPRDLLTLVELCTMRGIPDHPAKAQVILAILHHKIRSVFSPRSKLPSTDFEVVLHRRLNRRTHYFKNEVNFMTFSLRSTADLVPTI